MTFATIVFWIIVGWIAFSAFLVVGAAIMSAHMSRVESGDVPRRPRTRSVPANALYAAANVQRKR